MPLRDISILVTVAILDEGHSLEKFVSDFQGENMVMVYGFYATFNNISVILWQSVLFLEETRVPKIITLVE